MDNHGNSRFPSGEPIPYRLRRLESEIRSIEGRVDLGLRIETGGAMWRHLVALKNEAQQVRWSLVGEDGF